jgi:hypothetical protein
LIRIQYFFESGNLKVGLNLFFGGRFVDVRERYFGRWKDDGGMMVGW